MSLRGCAHGVAAPCWPWCSVPGSLAPPFILARGLYRRGLVMSAEDADAGALMVTEQPEQKSLPDPTQVSTADAIKELGSRISAEWQRLRPEDAPLSPLLAAFTARCVSLEYPERFNFERGVSLEAEQELVKMTMDLAASQDNPIFDTIKMQVTFESLYATELQKLRKKASKQDQQNAQLLDHVVSFFWRESLRKKESQERFFF